MWVDKTKMAHASLVAKTSMEGIDISTVQTQIVLSPHVNGMGRLFGGQLMAWIDVTAAVEARRFCGHDVTTACVDELVFHKPAHINDTLVLEANVTYSGNSSMEVRVDSYVEAIGGERDLVNTAYLILVAVDGAYRPTPVKPFKPATPEQQHEWEQAKKRRAYRLARGRR